MYLLNTFLKIKMYDYGDKFVNFENIIKIIKLIIVLRVQ